MAKKTKLAYVGDCSPKNNEILWHVNQKENCQLFCVCDSSLNRGLLCAERFETGFVEDFNDIVSNTDIKAVIFEAATRLPEQWAVDALYSGKAVMLLLSPATFSQLRAVEDTLLLAQGHRGVKGAFAVIDSDSTDEWLKRLPIAMGKLGELLNVYIGLPFSGDSIDKLEWEKYEACKLLYDLLGTPEDAVTAQNMRIDSAIQNKWDFAGAAAFKFSGGAIADVMVGGPCREKEICLYGTNGCVIMEGRTINYRLNNSDWIKEQVYPVPGYLSALDDFLADQTREMPQQKLELGMPAQLAAQFPFVV